MNRSLLSATLGALSLLPLAGAADIKTSIKADPPHACEWCEGWGRPGEPFKVFGNTWFVGGGLSSILITSKDGHILIDGGLTQSAADIAANIEELGFHLKDVKLIVNSHMHYDHAGGIAALQRASGAQVAASPASKRALERGGLMEDDPQFAFGPDHNNFPAVKNVREIADGEQLRVGPLAITAHFTPGHTPGGTSWTWRSCEGKTCADLAYADSLNSVSAPGFRFTGDATHPSRLDSFQHSIDVVAALKCDILLAPHPESIDLEAKLAARANKPARDPFFATDACKVYAEGARERLQKRIAEEGAPQ
jgi:metallo-beta-lactamase class B